MSKGNKYTIENHFDSVLCYYFAISEKKGFMQFEKIIVKPREVNIKLGMS